MSQRDSRTLNFKLDSSARGSRPNSPSLRAKKHYEGPCGGRPDCGFVFHIARLIQGVRLYSMGKHNGKARSLGGLKVGVALVNRASKGVSVQTLKRGCRRLSVAACFVSVVSVNM